MLLHEFPNLEWLKAQAGARFANRLGVGGIKLDSPGWPSVVLNTKTRQVVRDNIQGPLSIFTNISGSSHVTVDKRRVAVSAENFFLSNTGQAYTLEVNEHTPTETFNIHFGESFVEKAACSIESTPEKLIENHMHPNAGGIGFHNRLIPVSGEFRSVLKTIHEEGSNKLVLEEKLFELLALLIKEQSKVNAISTRLNAVKASTREEILRRLLTATDYLYTFYAQNPGLDELAQVSALSKFHFLRLFKLAYGKTPHQFVTSLKINKAKELLQKTETNINSIADSLGFDNSSSFSRTFNAQVGYYPSQYRQIRI